VSHAYGDWINTRSFSQLPADSKLRKSTPVHFGKARLRKQLVKRLNHNREQRKSRIFTRLGITGAKKKEYEEAGGPRFEVRIESILEYYLSSCVAFHCALLFKGSNSKMDNERLQYNVISLGN